MGLNLKQRRADFDLDLVGIVFDFIQRLDHGHHQLNFVAAESGFHQFIEFVDGLLGLRGGLDGALNKIFQQRPEVVGEGHLAADNQAGDVLGLIGNLILHGQVATGHRHEQALGHVEPQGAFQIVSGIFQTGDFGLLFSGLIPVMGEYGIEEGHKLGNAGLYTLHMFLQGPDWRGAEHVGYGSKSHNISSGCRVGCGELRDARGGAMIAWPGRFGNRSL